jgi:hypothetical protein
MLTVMYRLLALHLRTCTTAPMLYQELEDDDSPAEDATIPGRIQFPAAPKHLLPLSHHQAVETGNTTSQSQKEVSPTSTKNPCQTPDPRRLLFCSAQDHLLGHSYKNPVLVFNTNFPRLI